MPRNRAKIFTPLLVSMDEDFDVGVSRAEPVAALFQLVLNLPKIVDLTVGDDLDVAGLVQNRLLAARQINDGESAHAEPDAGQRDAALFVRPAMTQRAHHPLEVRWGNGPAEILFDNADNPAHSSSAPLKRCPTIPWSLSPEYRSRSKTRNLADHDGAGADNRIASDGGAIGHHHVRAQPRAVAHIDATRGSALLQHRNVGAVVE